MVPFSTDKSKGASDNFADNRPNVITLNVKANQSNVVIQSNGSELTIPINPLLSKKGEFKRIKVGHQNFTIIVSD
jgi:hypothetical protein